jgi:hypothetical protein
VLSGIPGFLLFPVLSDRIGVFCAVLPPVIGVAAAPFPRTVPANLAVLFVRLQFLLPVFNPPMVLTILLTASRLLRLVLRGLKSLLTIAATPFSHTRRYRIREKANLESDVEYLPRPRRWPGNLTTKPGKLRSFYTGADSLGTENENLPPFLVIFDAHGGPPGGPANWGSGFLPAAYQGTVLRPSNDPIFDLESPVDMPIEQQRARLNLLDKLNELHSERNPGSSELAARTASYELAFRMQAVAPEAIAIDREPEATRKLYGLDNPVTAPFGKQCLMARRLVERGVRFVQLFHGGLGSLGVDTWDAHIDVKENHTRHAAEVDRPIAALLEDLKATGLLDTTLVLWQTEFGRMPISQSGIGRDHNPGAMTVWMAGARIRSGQVIGASDEFGYKAEQQPVSVHDLHATILDLLGLDHKRLTFRHHGRDMRLTDVYGSLIPQINT